MPLSVIYVLLMGLLVIVFFSLAGYVVYSQRKQKKEQAEWIKQQNEEQAKWIQQQEEEKDECLPQLEFIYRLQILRIGLKEDLSWMLPRRNAYIFPVKDSEILKAAEWIERGIKLIDDQLAPIKTVDIRQEKAVWMKNAEQAVKRLNGSWQLPPEIISSSRFINLLRRTNISTKQINPRLN